MSQENAKKDVIVMLKKELERTFKKINGKTKYKRLVIHDMDNKFKQIIDYFIKYEDIIKKKMGNKNGDVVSLDRHKKAAAFFCAILKARPITVDDKAIMPNTPQTHVERQANEHFAYLFGLQIVQSILQTTIKKQASNEMDEQLYGKDIAVPPVHHSEYNEWFIKLVEGMDKHFDYDKKKSFMERLLFFISHIYFMIDSYSYEYNRAEFYKSELDKKPKTASK